MNWSMLLPTLGATVISVSLMSCGTSYKELRTKRGSKVEKKEESASSAPTPQKKPTRPSAVSRPKVEETKIHPGNISGIQFTAPDVSQKLPSQSDSAASLTENNESEEEKVILATPEAPDEVSPE